MDLYTTPAFKIKKLIDDKQLSKEEVVKYFAQRAAQDPYHAWVSIAKDLNHFTDGPLSGIPFAVDDSLEVMGQPNTHGSLLLKDHIAEEDDEFVAQLKEAGCVVLGKTNVSEFSLGDLTQNRLGPPTINPLNQEVCFGSSGGAAAAVVSGSVPLAIGSDVMGGFRLSAAHCKLFGLKLTGTHPQTCSPMYRPPTEEEFLCKGIIARDPRDMEMVLDVLGYAAPCCGAIQEKKTIGIFESMKPIEGYIFKKFEWHFDEEIASVISSLLACDRYLLLLKLKEWNPNFYDLLHESSCEWFCHAREVSGIDYAGALGIVKWIQQAIESLLEHCDFLITPVFGPPSFSLLSHFIRLYPVNLSGHPALVTPSGWQVIGHHDGEKELLAFATAHCCN